MVDLISDHEDPSSGGPSRKNVKTEPVDQALDSGRSKMTVDDWASKMRVKMADRAAAKKRTKTPDQRAKGSAACYGCSKCRFKGCRQCGKLMTKPARKAGKKKRRA